MLILHNRLRFFANLFFVAIVLLTICERELVAQNQLTPQQKVYASVRNRRPLKGDDTAKSLKQYTKQLVQTYGGKESSVPLDVKADHFEWVLRRYHQSPEGMVFHYATLSDKPGTRPTFGYGADVTTWEGALLAALSFKYAVTKDKETLKFIDDLLRGLRFSVTVTGKPGLAVRCIFPSTSPNEEAKVKYIGKDGTVYYLRSEAAKGTYNQLLAGYAAMFMFAADDLPKERQKELRNELAELVIHVIDHKYHLTERNGKRTKYGNIVPMVASRGIPFNAQVAYLIVATGHYFPPADPQKKQKIDAAFQFLRGKHHVYYEHPLKNLVVPQRVGSNPLVKGMNDRNHVLNAAYISLMLDRERARRNGGQPNGKFMYEMGRSMYWTMETIEHERNALCNFMWAGLLNDPVTFQTVLKHKKERRKAEWQLRAVTLTGIEQLRRFRVDYFTTKGVTVKHKTPQWLDIGFPHEAYAWKQGPYSTWTTTGPATNQNNGRIDYLYAFWVMRYHKLFERYQTQQVRRK